MSQKDLQGKSTEPKGRNRVSEASGGSTSEPLNLGCGTLIVLFLLVATAGKFLPYRDKSAVTSSPVPKTQPAAHKAKADAPSANKKTSQPSAPESTRRFESPGEKPVSDRAAEVFTGLVSQLQHLIKPEAKAVGDSGLVKPPAKLMPASSPTPGRPPPSALAKPALPTRADESPLALKSDPARRGEVPDVGVIAEKPVDRPQKLSAPVPGKSVVFNSPWDNSVEQVERYLKRRMHDASSMEILEWGKVSATDRGGYQVRCTFRSKNVLGNFATQSKVFVLNKEGEVTDIRD